MQICQTSQIFLKIRIYSDIGPKIHFFGSRVIAEVNLRSRAKLPFKVTAVTPVIMVIGLHNYIYLELELHKKSKYASFRLLSEIMQMWPFDKHLRSQFDLSGIKIRIFIHVKNDSSFSQIRNVYLYIYIYIYMNKNTSDINQFIDEMRMQLSAEIE